jgi:hypothetical protein
VAYCRGCDKAYPLSELARGVETLNVDLSTPPKGAWFRDDGMEASIGSVWRNLSTGVFFLIFSVFWNTITWGLLSAMLLGGTNVTGPGITHRNGVTTVDTAAYLFMIPFVLVGLGMATATIAIWFGRAEVTIRGKDAVLFRGVGSVGRRTPFDLTSVTGVSIEKSNISRNGRPMQHISIDGPGITFGTGFNKDQQKFIVASLRKVAGV